MEDSAPLIQSPSLDTILSQFYLPPILTTTLHKTHPGIIYPYTCFLVFQVPT